MALVSNSLGVLCSDTPRFYEYHKLFFKQDLLPFYKGANGKESTKWKKDRTSQ